MSDHFLTPDDDHWLATLAGEPLQAGATPDSVTLAEAQCLRQVLKRQENEINAQLAPCVSKGLDNLLERLRAESLLPPGKTEEPTTRSWFWSTGWAVACSVAVLLVFGSLTPLMFERDHLQITESANQKALVMRVENPLKHAQQMAADIRQAGGKVHIRKQANGHVMLYAEANTAVMATMRQHNMNPPMDHDMFVIAFIPMSEPVSTTPPPS